jgi:hypothetical protein
MKDDKWLGGAAVACLRANCAAEAPIRVHRRSWRDETEKQRVGQERSSGEHLR